MSNNIVQHISSIGGINPEKIRKAGTWTEWQELPGSLRSRIFRNNSSSGPDDMASQLSDFGIFGEKELIDYLKSPKLSLGEMEASAYDALEADYRTLQAENQSLRDEIAKLKAQMDFYENPYKAVASAGGIRRAEKLSPERRKEIARNAALARHNKNKENAA